MAELYTNVDARRPVQSEARRNEIYGPPQSMWADTPWFERSICFYMIAGTVGTIVYCFTGA